MMMMDELKARMLPALLALNNGRPVLDGGDWDLRRPEIIETLCEEIYGRMPAAPEKVTATVLHCDETAYAGKAAQSRMQLSFPTPQGTFSFPFTWIVPKDVSNPPVIVHIAFRADIPDIYVPAEEIVDAGFALAVFCYNDVTQDRDDGFSSGLAGMYKSAARKPDGWGKIAMWSYAASRIMDYLQTLGGIDTANIAIMGHSRLGKTALVTGAMDERYAFVISNDSGCSGAAITRGKTGEHVREICHNFSYWFCDNYRKYIDREDAMPFDQHFLLAAVAPRFLYVASALQDTWADPFSEYLCCVEVDRVYRLLDRPGFRHPDRYPAEGEIFPAGSVGYHLRKGEHYLGRYDWQRYMDFILSHRL